MRSGAGKATSVGQRGTSYSKPGGWSSETPSRTKRRRRVCPPSRWMVVGWVVVTATLLVAPLAHAGRPSGARGPAKTGGVVVSKPTHALAGRVVEVWRLSREVTVRTDQGTLQRVVIQPETAVKGPHGERGLDGIRSGMVVRVVDGADSHGRLVARAVVAQAKAEAELGGRPARNGVNPH